MKTKTRIILSALIIALFIAASFLTHLFYSPLTGIATAQSLNDSVAAYGAAKLLRDGSLETALFFVPAVLIGWIWYGPIHSYVFPPQNESK